MGYLLQKKNEATTPETGARQNFINLKKQRWIMMLLILIAIISNSTAICNCGLRYEYSEYKENVAYMKACNIAEKSSFVDLKNTNPDMGLIPPICKIDNRISEHLIDMFTKYTADNNIYIMPEKNKMKESINLISK